MDSKLKLIFFCTAFLTCLLFACNNESQNKTKENITQKANIQETVEIEYSKTLEDQFFKLDAIQLGCDENVRQHLQKLNKLFSEYQLHLEFYNNTPFILRINNAPYFVAEAEQLPQEEYNKIVNCIEKYKKVESLEQLFIGYEPLLTKLYLINEQEIVAFRDGFLLFFKKMEATIPKKPKCTTNYSDGGYTAEEVCHYFKNGRSLTKMYKHIVSNSGDSEAMPEIFPNYDQKFKGQKSIEIDFKEYYTEANFFGLKIELFFEGGVSTFILEENNVYFIITFIHSAD